MKILAVDYGESRTGLAICDATEMLTRAITPQIEEKSMNKVAEAVVELAPETLDLLKRAALPKGDVLTCAKVGGIIANQNNRKVRLLF